MQEWSRSIGQRHRTTSSWSASTSSLLPLLLVWASTNPTSATSSTTTFPRASKAIIRRQAELAETAEKASASLSSRLTTCASSRSSCKANPLQSRISVGSCCKRRQHTPRRPSADASSSCITSERSTSPRTAASATIASIRAKEWKLATSSCWCSKSSMPSRKASRRSTSSISWSATRRTTSSHIATKCSAASLAATTARRRSGMPSSARQ